jgi:hypothetical protein
MDTCGDVNDFGTGSPTSEQENDRARRRILDGAEALEWLRGTEVQKQLRGSEDVTISLLVGSNPSDINSRGPSSLTLLHSSNR